MQELNDLVQERWDAALAAQPGAALPELSRAIVDLSPVGPALDEAWASFRPVTRTVFTAHGAWTRWDPSAGPVAGVEPAEAQVALFELIDAGWVEPEDLVFGLAPRVWSAARLEPTDGMVERMAAVAEEHFHRSRLFDHEMAPTAVQEALAHAAAWSTHRRVQQWWLLAQRRLTPEEACAATRPWALFQASREAHLRGWVVEAEALFEASVQAATEPRARFVVAYIRAMRAVVGGDVAARAAVDDLHTMVTDDAERLLVLQVQVELQRRSGECLQRTLEAGVHLAQRLELPAREVHFLHLLAHTMLGDAVGLRRTLRMVDAVGARLAGAVALENRFLWACLAVVEDDLDAMRKWAVAPGDDPLTTGAAARLSLIGLLAAFRAGEAPDQAPLHRARRLLLGTEHEPYVHWAERVLAGGAWEPLPFGAATSRVATDGSWFEIDAQRRSLRDSPLARVLLAELVDGPRTAEQLIDRIWPGDAASYLSLRQRLHSLMRTVRRRGLGERLVFEGGRYELRDMVRVAPDAG